MGFCNTGTSITNLRGKIGHDIFGEDIDVWLHAGISNTVSISVMKKLGFHISYDSNDDYWVVSKGDMTVTFHKEGNGRIRLSTTSQNVTSQ